MIERIHSEKLREYFDISSNGIDYYNRFNISIEFKETFSNDILNIRIKIRNTQLDNSDLIVICHNHSEFYIHKGKFLKNKYKQKSKDNRTSIRFTSLKKGYIFKTDNYNDLEKYLNNFSF